MASTPLEQLSSCKRRKVVVARPVFIRDFSAEILKEVATYLAPPSRILFAIAITPPISPYETIMARSRYNPSIAGTDWITLDFGLIEKALAAKLSDEDVRDVLLHINAANNLKKLLLTNCTNITGIGLRPLIGSRSIEQLDLSLVGNFQSPTLIPKPQISCKIVLPILDSIISNEALCKLKYLQFPKVWRRLIPYKIDDFIDRYNQMLENRGQVCCLKCNQEVEEEFQPRIRSDYRFTDYGIQRCFCHECSSYWCFCCRPEDDCNFDFCSVCEREYCSNCAPMAWCGGCGDNAFCVDCCSKHSCASPNCDEKLCDSCKKMYTCDACNRTWCEECCQCYVCESCTKRYCHDCSFDRLQEGKLDCLACIKRVAPLIKQLKEENEELKNANKVLKNRRKITIDSSEDDGSDDGDDDY